MAQFEILCILKGKAEICRWARTLDRNREFLGPRLGTAAEPPLGFNGM